MLEVVKVLRRLQQTARLMVGLPDYDSYVQHRRRHHPEAPIMTYAEFFQKRQSIRYATADGMIKRCC